MLVLVLVLVPVLVLVLALVLVRPTHLMLAVVVPARALLWPVLVTVWPQPPCLPC